LQRLAKKRYVPATYLGILHAAAGDLQGAYGWLEKAFEERADGLIWLGVDPVVDPLRAHPRFAALLHRIGFSAR